MRIPSLRLNYTNAEQQPTPAIMASQPGSATDLPVSSRDQPVRSKDAETFASQLDSMATLPTIFGKLVCLASLKGRLAKYQVQLFDEWLSLSLEEQCLDLQRHVFDAATTGMLPDAWPSARAYSQLIPAGASEAERELYSGNLELLLDLLRGHAGS